MPYDISAGQILAQPVSAFFQGRALKLSEDASNQRMALANAENTRAQESHDTQQKQAQIQFGEVQAKKVYAASQQVMASDNPKALVEQQFPEFIKDFQAHGQDWSTVDNNTVKQLAQGVGAHAAAELGITPVKGDEFTLKPGEKRFQGTKEIAAAPDKPDAITPYQQAELSRQNAAAAEQARHNRATEAAANPFGANGVGGGGLLTDSGGPSGEDYLKTLPSNIASQVKALAEGRMQFPGGFALKSPYWQQMISAVSQYDPNFDAVNYNARSKTRNDFTSGKNAQNIKSLNTAIGHLGTLAGQVDATASHSFTPLNAAENYAAEKMGSAGPTQFEQTAGALASELTQVFRGSGGAEADVKRYLSELNVNASKEQKQAAVSNIVDLLHSRLAAIGDQYNQGMGTTSDPLTLLNPKAQAVLQKLSGASDQTTDAHPADIQAILKKYQKKSP